MKVYISVTDGVHCWYGIDQPNVGRPVLGIISLEGSTGRNFNITICVSLFLEVTRLALMMMHLNNMTLYKI